MLVVAACAFGSCNDEPDARVTWILHYPGAMLGDAIDAHGDLLNEAPDGVEVVTVVSSAKDAERLRKASGGKARLVTVEGGLSPWARDRYILYPRDGKTWCMLQPDDALPKDLHGDLHVPDALRATYPDLQIVRTRMAPEGGDVIVTRRGVIVGYASIAAAAERTGSSIHMVVRELSKHFARPLIVVGRREGSVLPPHVDVFLANAGKDRLLVAEVAQLPGGKADPELAKLGDFKPAFNRRVQEELDEIVHQLEMAGFEIHRSPALFSARVKPGHRYPLTLSYANAIREGGQVFVPSYGVPALDRAGREAWQRLGYVPVSIRSRLSLMHGGAVRCLTNRIPAESDI